MTANAVPRIPAAEFMSETRSVRDQEPVVSDGPDYKCPQCDTRADAGDVATWYCWRASCPSPYVTEEGGRR